MDDLSRLESLAQQLIARLRDDDPESNLRWLRAHTGVPQELPVTETERLLFVACAAVPDTERWSDLLAWCKPSPVDSPVDISKRRRMRRVA